MNKIVDKNIDLPWIEKYRPSNTNEILLDSFLLEKIYKIIEYKSIPNMILTGEPGTGKTSTILIIAKSIYTTNYYDNVLELFLFVTFCSFLVFHIYTASLFFKTKKHSNAFFDK